MRKSIRCSSIFFAFSLSSCGGGSGSSSTSPPPASAPVQAVTSHGIRLGPIVKASVTIYLPDCKTSVYQAVTDDNGNYNINVAQLKSALGATIPEMLCVESVGGTDIDPNDDGIRDANESIDVKGKIRGFVKANDILNSNGTRINLFGNAIADMLSSTDDVTVARVEQLASQLGIPDMDGDGKITVSDVTRYEMGSKTNGEYALRVLYLRSIHEGNTSDRNFFIEASDTSIAAVRPTFIVNGDKTLQISLTKFSRDGTVYYGPAIRSQLPNVYTKAFVARANEVVFLQECRSAVCYSMQAIQVNSTGTGFVEYSDTGGVDLSTYYSNVQSKNDLMAKMEAARKLIDQTNSQIQINAQQMEILAAEADELNAANKSIDEEIKRLKSGG